MPRFAQRTCTQCGAFHYRKQAEVCVRCERRNIEDARSARICPYCLKEKGKNDNRHSRYHSGCSHEVSEISKRATAEVVRAMKAGEIQRITPETKCVDCGKPARDYDHRHYRKPLDVVPVCRACNQKRGAALDLHSFYLEQA